MKHLHSVIVAFVVLGMTPIPLFAAFAIAKTFDLSPRLALLVVIAWGLVSSVVFLFGPSGNGTSGGGEPHD